MPIDPVMSSTAPRTTTAIVGVDPGGRNTGVVVRIGSQCRYRAVVTRDTEGVWPDATYLIEVRDTVRRAIEIAGASCVVAVEGVVNPSPHLGLSNPGGIIAAGMVLGAILVDCPDALVVRPGRHGSQPLSSYPGELIGPRETSGAGKLRHARSAWDVAGSALFGA